MFGNTVVMRNSNSHSWLAIGTDSPLETAIEEGDVTSINELLDRDPTLIEGLGDWAPAPDTPGCGSGAYALPTHPASAALRQVRIPRERYTKTVAGLHFCCGGRV